MNKALTIALPKGRLINDIYSFLKKAGIDFSFNGRELVCYDRTQSYKFILVKNSDLPIYVNHGIAGLGICGEDVIFESGYEFFKIFQLPLGSTRMCLAGWPDSPWDRRSAIKVATKFPKFSFNYFHTRSIPVQIIKLEGSVELAPVLGLTDYIVDLAQTGSTLEAHDLDILEVLAEIKVFLIANPADYKVNYKQMELLAEKLLRVNI